MDTSSDSCLEPDVLAAYVDDVLDTGERHRVDAHIDHCAGCRREVSALAAVVIPLCDTRPLAAATVSVGLGELPERYAPIGVIGAGGMGEILLAEDRQIGREVAIKRMLSSLTSSDEARFVREARIQSRLEHPAIVPVHEVATDSAGLPFFVMKRLSGTTLAEVLASAALGRHKLLRAFADVCLAIEFAHRRGVVHRDLKPSNIMLGDFGEVYVLDWGIARIISDTDDLPAHPMSAVPVLTQGGAILGTPGYMAPEQLARSDVDARADIYALGCILFEVLVGKPLWPRETPRDALAEVDARPSQRAPEREVPPELEALCVEATHSDCDARLASARELADRIQRYLDGDRDLERRRQLALDEVSAARAANAAGDRATAIRRAGRAIALDPESQAAELLSALIVEPPATFPPELIARLDEIEHANTRSRAGRGVVAQVGVLLFLLLASALAIKSWLWFAVLCAMAVAMVVRLWRITRSGYANLWVTLVFYAAVGFVWSRFAGPFVLMPTLACGAMTGMAGNARIQARPWLIPVWLVTAFALPMIAEYLGILEQTWFVDGDGLTSVSAVIATNGSLATVILIAGNLGFMILIGMWAVAMSRIGRNAERRLEIQAWHLGQLLPVATR